MLSKIAEFFNSQINQSASRENTTGKQSIALATCALLLEMAHADSEFSTREQQEITSKLQEQFSLNAADTQALMALAESERKESLDLWQFTNLINIHFTNDQKAEMLEILWSVIYADGKVDMHEEYLMRRLNNLLNMDHKDMIDAKIRARDIYQEGGGKL